MVVDVFSVELSTHQRRAAAIGLIGTIKEIASARKIGMRPTTPDCCRVAVGLPEASQSRKRASRPGERRGQQHADDQSHGGAA
jgi:hypothetical protein